MGDNKLLKSISVWMIIATATTVLGAPGIALPINSQVPPVARVDKAFEYQFADTTFTSQDPSSLVYALMGAPSWLTLDSATRTFSGTPANKDMGPLRFALNATDSTGSTTMAVTLIVINSPTPKVSPDLGTRLGKFGSRSGSTSLEYYSNEAFNVMLTTDVFQGASNMTFYATSANRSPLPSWINFDPVSVTFSGVTPMPITSPDIFGVALFASSIPGFAEASVTFSFVVSNHKLVFVPLEQSISIAGGSELSFTSLKSQLMLDNHPIGDDQIESSQTQIPSWMRYDTQTLSLSGTPPPGVTSQDVTIIAFDIYGDRASTLIRFHFKSLIFAGKIGILDATIGKSFTHQIDRSLFTHPDVHLTFDLGAASSWLKFDKSTLTLHGNVPHNLRPTYDHASITATLPSRNLTETQHFQIHIIREHTSASQSTRSASNPPNTERPSAVPPRSSSGHTLSGKVIVAITIISIIAFLACLLAIFCLLRRRRKRRGNNILSTEGVQIKQGPSRRVNSSANGGNTGKGDLHDEQPSSRPPQLSGEIRGVGSSIRSSKYGCSSLRYDEPVTGATNYDTKQATDLSGMQRLKQNDEASKPRVMSERDSSYSSPLKHQSHVLSRSSQRTSGLPTEYRFTGLGHGRSSYATHSRVFGSLMRSYTTDSSYASQSDMSMRRQIDSFPFAFRGSKSIPAFEGADRARRWIRKVSEDIQEERSSEITTNIDSRFVEERRQNYTRRRASDTRSSNPIFGSSNVRIGSGYFKRRRQLQRSSTSPNLDSSRGMQRFALSSVLLQHVSHVPRMRSGGTLSSFRTSDGWETTEDSFAGSNDVLEEENEEGEDYEYDDDFDEELSGLPSDRDRQEWHNRWSQRLIRNLGFEPNGTNGGDGYNAGRFTRSPSSSSSHGPRMSPNVTMSRPLRPQTTRSRIYGHLGGGLASHNEGDIDEERAFL